MTKDEALKLALEALEDLQSLDSQDVWLDRWSEAITAIKKALALEVQEPINHEDWLYNPMTGKPIWGDLSAQPEERNFCPRCGKRTADLATIHTCTPPIAAGSQAFYGFPDGPVSTPNAGGKCVTAGETAP